MESCAAPDVDAELGEVEAVEDAEADADARADSKADACAHPDVRANASRAKPDDRLQLAARIDRAAVKFLQRVESSEPVVAQTLAVFVPTGDRLANLDRHLSQIIPQVVETISGLDAPQKLQRQPSTRPAATSL